MKKAYCNCCEEEITQKNIFSHVKPLEIDLDNHKFHVAWPDTQAVDFDVCKYCVIDAINKHDDRPKVQP